ncbi:MAG: heavy-metal-associated domain-containing protein [Aquificaceae bacterium]|nr:heavy-metal-associated domain-containing protein [Aquificaceae bacterium]MCX8076699.1 heavy-metal-associated domain-containing protein [Aquificaceae bacterium]MDW8095810.1 heavy-metal-associated domain-containing protein [Aquificaceae bacterium]MDW8434151.1 heavy-metal-associated domain-containing protein [Aquificaceae bacterium]
MVEKCFKVDGMTCQHCVNTVKRALYAVEGVSHVDVSLEEGKVRVHMEKDIPSHLLKSAVEEWGYRVLGEI